MSKYTWSVRATRKVEAVVSSSLVALVGRLDACTLYVPLPLSAQCPSAAARRVKGQFNPAKEKKFKKKKIGRKGSGGRKEAQQERGVLSWAGLHKILANSGEKRRPEIRNGCSPSGPKGGLGSAQRQSICVARGARAGWTAMRRQGRPQIECEAGQGRGWMERASVWDGMRRALGAPPRWTRAWAGERGGGIGYLQTAERCPRWACIPPAAQGPPHSTGYLQALARGAWSTSTSLLSCVSWRRLRISTMGLPEAFNHVPARPWA